MADEPDKPLQVERVPSYQGDISAIASATAPFLYFDGAPTFGWMDGIANITLEAVRHSHVEDKALTDRVVVAHLRMSYKALQSLKSAINGIELMVTSPPGGKKN